MKNIINNLINLTKNLKVSKKWLNKFTGAFNEGILNLNKKAVMTTRKIEIENNDIPNKKLCIEKSEDQKDDTETLKKKKTRRVVFLLSYMGNNYHGIQKANGFKTIEGELFEALHKANFIDKTEHDSSSTQFQITARTDKGVSAVKQVVSLKIADTCTAEAVNKYLPEDIRILSVKRVTKGFCCTSYCTARTYSYTLPTFALAPELHKKFPKDYRIDEETLLKVNDLLLLFTGTHNFHNFTSKKSYSDPSAKRYILTFKAEEPFINQGEQFITLKIKGQSFMMHQIRKMVGHVIKTMKGFNSPDIESLMFSKEKINVPRAPGLGLVLENIHFDRYNNKYANDGFHESLDWNELENEINKFKNKIMSNIIKKEIEERIMFHWILDTFQDHGEIKSSLNNSDCSELKNDLQ